MSSHTSLQQVTDDELVAAGDNPKYDYPPYVSTGLRHPKKPLLILPETLSELTGPIYGESALEEFDNDLTRQFPGEPLGERIIVTGRLLDRDGRPVRGQLIEVWQANSAGRYKHEVDQHPAPLDPNFGGAGRCVTDDDGRYRFTTIKPGSYPWGNHPNAWRPAHIHFSILGRAFTERLVTQMYFPGDQLFDADPIFQSVRDEKARERMISRFSWDITTPDWAHGYEWDIVVGGPYATPLDEDDH
jgi:protocatechuate 3,4-dioxygenase, beta subunit